MPEVLTELVAKISTDADELKKGLSDAEKQTEASSKRMQDSLKKVGAAMAASGAAITAAMGLMGKAAIDEDINIKRLGVALKGVGVNYDNVKDSLENVIAVTQRKTGIADSEQRDVLGRLILVTKDYDKALGLLPLTLDLAAAGQMDASTAATYLSKAYLDLEGGAEEIGIRIGQATVNFKNLDEVQKLVGGTAEATANPFIVLAAAIGDVAETIGRNLIPLIKDAVDKIVDITGKIQEWAIQNPETARTLTLVAGALGIFLTVGGGLILILPTLVAQVTALGVVFHLALGPLALVSAALSGLVIAGTLIVTHWDSIRYDLANILSGIKMVFLNTINSILDAIKNLIWWIPELVSKVDEAKVKLSGMIEEEKTTVKVRELEYAAAQLEKQLKATGDTGSMAFNGVTNSITKTTGAFDALQSRLKAGIIGLTAAGKQLEPIPRAEEAQFETYRMMFAYENRALSFYKPGITYEEFVLEYTGMPWYEYRTKYGLPAQPGEYKGATPVEVAENYTGTPMAGMSEFQHGGIVPGPVGAPQMALVHGGETVIPAGGGMGGVTINFTEPVFFDREDTMNRFVDKISKTLDRKYRLSGRSLA